MRLVFLVSLPRSGSTLLQRILASHPEIATAAEPWLMLPVAGLFRDDLGPTPYDSRIAANAIEEFATGLPGGGAVFDDSVREWAEGVYQLAARGKPIFLDKTPRYHLIADTLARVFPDARFIVLWRNPLAVAASIIETWGAGRWVLPRYDVDLREGVDRLVAFQSTTNRALAVRYEDILTDFDGRVANSILTHLGLERLPLDREAISLEPVRGAMGDNIGTHTYSSVSLDPLEKWKGTLSNPLRRAAALGYLHRIGAGNLAAMGYDLSALRMDLLDIPLSVSHVGSDLLDMPLRRIWAYLRWLPAARDRRIGHRVGREEGRLNSS